MERVAYELCTRLLQRGWRLTVIARSCALAPNPRLHFVRLWAPARPVSFALAASFVHGTFALLRRRGELVHTNNAVVANRVDVISVHFCEHAYRERVRSSRSSRDNPLYRLNSKLASGVELLAESWCYRPSRVRRLACVSRGVAGELCEYFPAVSELTRTITNGVDRTYFAPDVELRTATRASLGVGDADLVALFVGGDWQRKGLRHAIEGIAGAPGWSLVVVGAGDETGFGRLAHELRIADRVVFTGKLADPRPFYAAADLLLLPSSYEAFPLVALEASASGLGLITPRINGTEELVQDGVNGWFTPAHGEAIATRLRELGEDRARLAAARAAARRASERYDWTRIVDRYEALYVELGSGAG
jgi:glycosyltransferase involved in cell wall biosynthesis